MCACWNLYLQFQNTVKEEYIGNILTKSLSATALSHASKFHELSWNYISFLVKLFNALATLKAIMQPPAPNEI